MQGALQSHGAAGRAYSWTSSAAIVPGSYCTFAGTCLCGPPGCRRALHAFFSVGDPDIFDCLLAGARANSVTVLTKGPAAR